MEFRKKTAILLIAIFILSTLAIAIPVNATEGIILGKSGDGYAIWTSEQDYQSEYSVKLHTGTTYPNWGFMKIPIEPVLLQALEDEPSYWVFEPTVLSGGRAPLQSGDHHPWGHPYINMVLDLDGNPATIDKDYLEGIGSTAGLVTDGTAVDPSPSVWTEMTEGWGYWDSDDTISLGFSGQDGETGAFIYHSLAEWKAEMLAGYPDATVVEVQICYGYWPTEINEQCNPVYVDDMTIGGVTYELEPNHEVVIDVESYMYHIIATYEGPGSISPADVTITYLDSQEYIMTPDAYCYLSELTVDGTPVALGDTYTIVAADLVPILVDPETSEHTIHAVFTSEIIGISVEPLSWDFGPVPIGGTSGTTVTVSNTGDIPVHVDAGLEGLDTVFFDSYLKIGSGQDLVAVWAGVDVVEEEIIPLLLDLTTAVPGDVGYHSATLVFEITPPQPE